MKVKRRYTPLLASQLITQEKRITNCSFDAYCAYYWDCKEAERNEGSFYSKRFKTKTS